MQTAMRLKKIRVGAILIVLRARTQGMPFVMYPEDLGSPQQQQKRSLTATLRWYHITSSRPQHRVLHAPPTQRLHPHPSERDVRPHLTPRLLARGADPNLKDKYNASPLQYAVQPERLFGGAVPGASPVMVDMAKLLIEYGGFCLAQVWRRGGAFEIDACPSSGADCSALSSCRDAAITADLRDHLLSSALLNNPVLCPCGNDVPVPQVSAQPPTIRKFAEKSATRYIPSFNITNHFHRNVCLRL
jgi:hypothetical protein